MEEITFCSASYFVDFRHFQVSFMNREFKRTAFI